MWYRFRVKLYDVKNSVCSIYYHNTVCNSHEEVSEMMKMLKEKYKDDNYETTVTYMESTEYDY